MDKELELENKFIQLWNNGNSYDEISEMIGVDIEKIGQWGTDLIIANNELFDEEKFAVEKTKKGKYIERNLEGNPHKFLFKLIDMNGMDCWEIISIRIPHNASLLKEVKEDKKITIFYRFPEKIKTPSERNFSINNFKLTAFDSINEHIGKTQNYEFRIIANEPLIKESLDNRLFNSRFPDLPFCIKQFAFKNFQRIRNILIRELPINCQWIFLTGENGFGKTTILKAFAKTLVDRNIYKRLALELKINYKNHLFDPYFKVIKLQNFASYGASRLTLQQPDAKNEIGRKSETLYSLFNTDGILLNIEIELVFWKLENDPRFKKVKHLLISVVPDLKDIIIKKREVLYIEESPEKQSYHPVKFDELAAGYKSVIAMVGDIYLRLSKHQPDVEIKDLGGIVLLFQKFNLLLLHIVQYHF